MKLRKERGNVGRDRTEDATLVYILLVCQPTVDYRMKYLNRKILNINEFIPFRKRIAKKIKSGEIKRIDMYLF